MPVKSSNYPIYEDLPIKNHPVSSNRSIFEDWNKRTKLTESSDCKSASFNFYLVGILSFVLNLCAYLSDSLHVFNYVVSHGVGLVCCECFPAFKVCNHNCIV